MAKIQVENIELGQEPKEATTFILKKHHVTEELSPHNTHTSIHEILDRENTYLSATDYDINVIFSFRTFWKELFYNLCWPISVPFAIYNEGIIGAQNRLLVPSPLAPAIMNYLSINGNIILVLGNIVFWSYKHDNPETDRVSTFELFVFNGLCIFRFIAIAVKYGYLPKSDMHRMNHELIPFDQLQKMQLVYGWRPIPDNILQQALTRAEKRRNVDLSTIPFMQNSNDQIYGNNLFFTIWRASTDVTAKSMNKPHCLIAFIAILASLNGVLARIYLGIPWFIDNDWRPIVFVAFSMFSNFAMTGVNVMWMMMTWLDMKRRLYVFQRWTALLSAKKNLQNRENEGGGLYDDERVYLDVSYVAINDEIAIKQLDLQDFEQIYHWYQCFLLIKEFGKRWSKRLETDCFIFMVILAVIAVLFMMIISQHFGRFNLNFDALKLDLYPIDIIVGCWIIIYAEVVFFIICCTFYAGKQINDEFAEQNRLLSEAKTHIVYQQGIIQRECNNDLVRNKEEYNIYYKLEISKKMIESIIEMMEIEERDDPIKIMGLKTNGGLVTIMGSFTTVIGALISSTVLQ